jgi:uncharacterized surface protein with fasciclin (FAS1) repeats
MSYLNNLAKRVIGLASVVVAGTIVVLPASAQLNSPNTSNKPQANPVNTETAPVEPNTSAADLSVQTGASTETMTPETESSTPATELEAPAADTSTEMEMPTTGASTEMNTPAATEMPATETPKSEAPAATPAKPEAAAPTSDTPAIAAAANGTIVDIASASDSFKTLVAALNEAELAELLQGEGPFTVFAPTDAAFAALPEGTVEELLKPENRDRLVKILSYHVVSGEYKSDQLTSGQVATVEGSPVTVTVNANGVKVNDATVTQPDVQATNGVIHVIDQVILPPDLNQGS